MFGYHDPGALLTLTRGFLSAPRLIREDGALRLQCRFFRSAYDSALFRDMGIPFLDPIRVSLPKRQAEFLAGRILAGCAQAALGRAPAPVDIGPGRAPRWQDGLAGSISHADGLCACLVTDRPGLLPGIDMEKIADDDALDAIFSVCLNGTERRLVGQDAPFAENIAATIAFSAKETLFKALYPRVGRFFDFRAATLMALTGDGRVRLRLTQTLTPDLRENQVVVIRYEQGDGQVTTWLIFDAGRQQT